MRYRLFHRFSRCHRLWPSISTDHPHSNSTIKKPTTRNNKNLSSSSSSSSSSSAPFPSSPLPTPLVDPSPSFFPSYSPSSSSSSSFLGPPSNVCSHCSDHDSYLGCLLPPSHPPDPPRAVNSTPLSPKKNGRNDRQEDGDVGDVNKKNEIGWRSEDLFKVAVSVSSRGASPRCSPPVSSSSAPIFRLASSCPFSSFAYFLPSFLPSLFWFYVVYFLSFTTYDFSTSQSLNNNNQSTEKYDGRFNDLPSDKKKINYQ